MNRKSTHCNYQFFKIDKLLARLIKKKKKHQVTILGLREDITRAPVYETLKGQWNKQQHANSFDNLDEMNTL